MDYENSNFGCNYGYNYGYNSCKPQTHVHEIEGSVYLSGPNGNRHDHRFASVSDEVILVPGGHIHNIQAKTDYYEDHYHKINVRTGLGIPIGGGHDARHIHYADSITQFEDGHAHKMLCATLIENPNGAR